MYRKFQLENSLGEKWDLTDHTFKSYFNNPSGLGFAQNIETLQHGLVQSVTSSVTNFPSVSGDILFWDEENASKYGMYEKFVTFCTYTPLKLHYRKPYDNDVYTLLCEVSSLNKTEVKEDSMLTCSVTFQGLSMWMGEEVTRTSFIDTYTVENRGHYPVGFEITIKGSLVNPTIKLFQNHELYGEAKFDDATAFSSIYVNSKDGEQNIELMQGTSVLPNPLAYQDLSISNGAIYVTFVKLARGSTNISIGKTSGSISNVEIKFTPQYRSV